MTAGARMQVTGTGAGGVSVRNRRRSGLGTQVHRTVLVR